MAIEKRKLRDGTEVGWNTDRKCYCKLPKELKNAPVTVPIDEMEYNDLKALGVGMGLDFPGNISKANLITIIEEAQEQ